MRGQRIPPEVAAAIAAALAAYLDGESGSFRVVEIRGPLPRAERTRGWEQAGLLEAVWRGEGWSVFPRGR